MRTDVGLENLKDDALADHESFKNCCCGNPQSDIEYIAICKQDMAYKFEDAAAAAMAFMMTVGVKTGSVSFQI